MGRMLGGRIVAVVATMALSACGGGGGGSSAPGTVAPPVPTATPTAKPGGTQTNGHTSFTLTLPRNGSGGSARGRAPQFASPGAQSVSIQLTTVNGAAPSPAVPAINQDLVTANPNCAPSGSYLVCTIPADVPVGNDIFAVTLYAGLGQTGTVLGQSAAAAATVVANATNRVALTVNGNVASLQMLATPANLTSGSAASGRVFVIPLDASQNQIINPGNYAQNITVSTNDGSGHLKLQVNGGAPAASVISSSPSDIITFNYDGNAGYTGTQISAAAGSVTSSIPMSFSAFSYIVEPRVKALWSGSTLTMGSGGNADVVVTAGSASGVTFSGGCPGMSAMQTASGIFNITVGGLGTCTATITGPGSTFSVNVVSGVTASPSGISWGLVGQNATVTLSGGVPPYTASNNAGLSLSSMSTSSTDTLTLNSTAFPAPSVVFTDAIGQSTTITGTLQLMSVAQTSWNPPAGPAYGPQAISGTPPISVTRGWSNTITASGIGATTAVVNTCSPYLTMSGTNPYVLTGTAAGSCTIKLTDGAGNQQTAPVQVGDMTFATYGTAIAYPQVSFTGTGQTDVATMAAAATPMFCAALNQAVATISPTGSVYAQTAVVSGTTFYIKAIGAGETAVRCQDNNGYVTFGDVLVTTTVIPIL